MRKTERIRRRGFFISGLGFGVAAICIFGMNRMGAAGGVGVDLQRKIIFALCFVMAMFVLRITFRRRERLKRERQEQAPERMLLQKADKSEE